MQEVILPTGNVVQFPDDMSSDDIAAVLRERFGQANTLPHLGDGETLRRPNGATIKYSAEFDRFFVRDTDGRVHGWFHTLANAIAVADASSAQPQQRTPCRHASRPAPAASNAEIERQIEANVASHIRRERERVRRENVAERRRKWWLPRKRR